MDIDEAIEAWATQAGVRVLFGAERLVDRLVHLADTCNFFYPPTAEEVAEEVGLVMPGLGEPATARAPEASMDLGARQVIIQHASVVNVYTIGATTRSRMCRTTEGEPDQPSGAPTMPGLAIWVGSGFTPSFSFTSEPNM